MNRKFGLQPLLDLMRDRSDEATRQLGRLIAEEQNARSRLEMLEQYRAEYAERLLTAVSEGLTVQIINNYREFLERIDGAIEQQTEQVRRSDLNTQRGKQHWQQQNTRMKAIDTLSIRHETRVRYQENKLEQKLLDEYAARQFRNKKEDPEQR